MSQFNTEDLNIKKYERAKYVDDAKRSISNAEKKEKDKEYADVDTGGIAIIGSWLKSGVNKIRSTYNEATGDKETLKKINDNEKLNQKVRDRMIDSYTWKNAVSDAMDVATVVAIAGLVATGVGAGAGMALAGRMAVTKSAQYALKKTMAAEGGSVVTSIGKAGLEAAKKSPNLVKESVVKSVEKGLSGTLLKNPVEKVMLVPNSIKLLNQATSGNKVASAIRLGSGLSTSSAAATSFGIPVYNRAKKSVVEQNKSDKTYENLKKENNGETPTVKEILKKRNKERYGQSHISVIEQSEKENKNKHKSNENKSINENKSEKIKNNGSSQSNLKIKNNSNAIESIIDNISLDNISKTIKEQTTKVSNILSSFKFK